MARKHTINASTFAHIDSEQLAYCLGFLVADGWIMTKNKGVSVAVSPCDAIVLDYIRKSCGSNAPMNKKTNTYGNVTYVLNLCSMQLVSDLATLGVVPNKTHVGWFPDINPIFHRHLLRGLFDGDGWIGTRQFALIGNTSVLSSVADIGRQKDVSLHVGLGNGYPRLIGGKRCASFLHWMYRDIDFALPRKLQTYETYWK